MVSNNEYYHLIAEIVTHTTIEDGHTDNYYLKIVAEEYGYTYSTAQCKGKLLKDITEYICDKTITGSHTNLYYLIEMANELLHDPLLIETENNCLKAVYENIENLNKKTTSLNMVAPSHIVYTDNFIVTGSLIDTSESPAVPMENSTVKLYIGNTEVASAVTNENGEVEFTSTPAHMGIHIFQLKYAGTLGYRASESSTATVNVDKETTIINLSSPSSGITVFEDDTVSVSGSLTDDDLPTAHLISDKTITVYNDLIYKRSNSGLSILNQTLASSYKFSNYTGQLIIGNFEATGNAVSFGSNYFMILQGASIISEVTGLSNISVRVNGNIVTVNGTDYDLTQYNIDLTKLYSLENGSVEFYGLDGGLLDTYTTGDIVEGMFSGNIDASDIGIGEHTLSIIFDGDEYYTSSRINRTVNVLSFDSIVLSKSSGHNPVSAYDSETCTLSAQLQYNGSDVSLDNVNILFYDYTDSTNPVYLGSDYTDATGKAEYTYTGTGAGDIIIKAKSDDGIIVSETYSIEDLGYYNSGDHIDDLTVDSGVSISTDGSVITIGSASSERYVKLPVNITDRDFEFKTTVANSVTTNYKLAMICNSNTYIQVGESYISGAIGGTTERYDTSASKVNTTLTLRYESGVFYVYWEDTLIFQKTMSMASNSYCGYWTSPNRTQIIKNIKFKYL